MSLEGKKILIVGLAKTGISIIKYLNKLNTQIIVNDIKNEKQLEEILAELKGLENVEYILGYHPEYILDLELDLVIVSPGVSLELPFITKLKENKIKLIGEVELAYQVLNTENIVAITGTNGKTTTTSLVGEVFNKACLDTYIVGNIGNPVIDVVDIANEKSVLVAELSSFQLESIDTFKPSISAILNFTEDHLNRHKTMDNYINAKCRIYENQKEDDIIVLNYDDLTVRSLSESCMPKVIFFSRKEKLSNGIYVEENGDIIINIDKRINLMNKKELSLPGNHNLENVLATIAISYMNNINLNTLKDILKTFGGVSHRQEYVTSINGVSFVNDSKGTNPDSTIKAVESYENPVILIAGGIDKKSDFNELLDFGKSKIKALVLLGETAPKIQELALEKGYNNIVVVSNMEEAVKSAYKLSTTGDVVLLSPACASWDMYKNFEERGDDFKRNVLKLSL